MVFGHHPALQNPLYCSVGVDAFCSSMSMAQVVAVASSLVLVKPPELVQGEGLFCSQPSHLFTSLPVGFSAGGHAQG